MIIKLQPRRVLARPRALLVAAVVALLLYGTLVRFRNERAIRWGSVVDFTTKMASGIQGQSQDIAQDPPQSELQSQSSDEEEDATETEEEAQETALRAEFKAEYDALESLPGAKSIYGSTIAMLSDRNTASAHDPALTPSAELTAFTLQQPYVFNPYPKYNDAEWSADHAEYVPCIGATGAEVQDISVFKGRLREFPAPSFGGFDLFELNEDLCFERETKLGQYGLGKTLDIHGKPIEWEKVDWGGLQEQCVERNKARFETENQSNAYLTSVYESLSGAQYEPDLLNEPKMRQGLGKDLKRAKQSTTEQTQSRSSEVNRNTTEKVKEPRTALLLRSYTGKEYTDNDKQVIRSLITELNLRTGGDHQIYLLVQVKEDVDIYADDETYDYVLQNFVPEEFWSITVLWSDALTRHRYQELHGEQTTVHNAQFLSVQLFMQQHREFDFVWNWEMDSRLMGQHYDVLSKLAKFARKQPRKGLWERNERFYIPSFHGEYDTTFRKTLEQQYGNDSIWGPPELPFIKPVGPAPPVASPGEDDYEWGVGEDADLITVAPIFNPVNSKWVLGDSVWGYNSEDHPSLELPRRGTIVTQSRLSRRLIDIMHVENLRGNLVGSEMVAQTVSLLHGLKAVYAPLPVFSDRPWKGERLARWFNPGPDGDSGKNGSAFGWGRERRFQGLSWYYRAEPPQRLYNNWMGYEDSAIGGKRWEAAHGRPCLPAMFLHPVKSVKPTEPGFSSNLDLPYG